MRTIVIGGGIVGLASAYKLLAERVSEHVTVLEKEEDVGQHQSTHNSGVLHAGLYYTPGSLKARLARAGLREMLEFCRRHAIPHEQCGKLVVATDSVEEQRLRDLASRGEQNGLVGLKWLSSSEIRGIEPHAAGVAALHVPEEGIVDFAGVCARLRLEIQALGGAVVTGARVHSLARSPSGWQVEAGNGVMECRMLVNCAGLHADRVARLAGERPTVRIVPFRGEYWLLRGERAALVRNLIYPVPNPSFPFLGVHFTRMIHGGVEAGPNAVIALAREGYTWLDISARDMADALVFPGLWRFLARYPRMAWLEIARSFSKTMFTRSLQRLVPEIRAGDLVRGSAGVRAQAMSRDGQLVQDFHFIRRPYAVHVLNAPSPAATASLAIGHEIALAVTEASR